MVIMLQMSVFAASDAVLYGLVTFSEPKLGTTPEKRNFSI